MAVNNSLVAKSKAQQNLGITEYLTKDAIKNQINKVVGGKNGQRFISAIVSAYNTNPTLQECTNQSILSAALLGESLQLSPSPQLGHYYMVPFNNTKTGVKEAQFQMGYKGYIQLAIRSGQYKRLNVVAIKEGELEYTSTHSTRISRSISWLMTGTSVKRLRPSATMQCLSL